MDWLRRGCFGVFHTHHYKLLTTVKRAPVAPCEPHHTSYVLLACPCGSVKPFPTANWLLTTPEHRKAVEAQLASADRFIELDADIHPL